MPRTPPVVSPLRRPGPLGYVRGMTGAAIDPTFLALPYRDLGDVALARARELGASHADFRFERVRYQHLGVRDGVLQGAADNEDLGFAVRVIHRGAWGFAAGVVLTPEEAAAVAERAVAVAGVAAEMTTTPVEIAPEPVHDDVTWVSAYDVNPLEVPTAEKAALLIGWTDRLRAHDAVEHATASLQQVQENKYYADLAGTRTTQQRVRMQPHFEAMGTDAATGVFDSMSTIAPPVGRGWEYLTDGTYDWDAELAQVPDLLAEKLAAPSVEAGTYDLVIHPSNLWLTIHESIGHATELDRALGYEANYAGTSFATYDKLHTLQYGSPVMNVTGDRTVHHGLSTVGYDDEGVEAQAWDIVRDGVLVGYQLDRAMAHMKPELSPTHPGGRSNGCAYADSPGHVPIQRMANVSLQPSPDDISTDDLVGRVERGLYVVGDKSWSIDMQRFNFQFTGQRFFEIVDGRLGRQVRDVAYQATTTDFWNSLEEVGGEQTWVLGGAFNCGKAQPGQVAAVSHGCPSALFRGIRILNTTDEAGER
jgi:TldD protein